jgi:hypothetical protein
MRQKKRTEWILWACDLEGCDVRAATHKEFGDPELPEGWRTIDPPRMWRGPSLAFCSKAHYDQFVTGYVRPLLEGGRD